MDANVPRYALPLTVVDLGVGLALYRFATPTVGIAMAVLALGVFATVVLQLADCGSPSRSAS